MRGLSVILAAMALAAPAAAAAPLVCIAQQQCRGDAQTMCAPATTRIEAERKGAGGVLWIDLQGPFAARIEQKTGAERWNLTAFGGSHWLELNTDGTFLYRGNRGKRYTGTCGETS